MYRKKYIEYIRYEKKKKCVLRLVVLWRQNKLRKYISMRNNATMYIQLWFRGVMYRRSYIQYLYEEQQNITAECIQIWFRGKMYRKKYIEYIRYEKKKKCVLRLVVLWRQNKLRKYISMRNNATMYIQIWFKGVMCRTNYIKYLYKEKVRNNAVMYVQLWFRGIIHRKRYVKYIVQQMRNNAAMYIQSWFKEKMCRRNCIYMINKKRRYIRITNNAAKYIQIWFKCVIYRRQYVEYLNRKKIKNNATMY
eukprot:475478_1